MLDKDLVAPIYYSIHRSGLTEDVMMQIMDYVEGEANEIKLSPIPGIVEDSMYYRIKEIGRKDEKLARRCYYVAALLDPSLFFEQTQWETDYYELYYKMGLETSIVVEGIWKKTEGKLLNMLDRLDTLQIFRELECNYGEKRIRDFITKANTYYGDGFRAYLSEQRKNSKCLSPMILYMGGIWAAQSPHNASQEIQALEEEIEKLIPAIYDRHPHFISCYSEEEKAKWRTLVLPLSIFLYKKSKKLCELIGEQSKLMGYKSFGSLLEAYFRGKTDEMTELLVEAKVPDSFRVALFADRMLENNFHNMGEAYHEHILAIYREEPESVMIAYQKTKEEKEPGAYLLFAFLRARGMEFKAEELSELEKLLMDYFTQLVAKNQQQRSYDRDIRLYQVPLMLYEVSQVARKQLQEVMEVEEMQNILTDAVIVKKLFYIEIKGNILEEIAKEMGVELILQLAIEREPNLSPKLLKEFVKLHLGETDKLMKDKIKEGSSIITNYVEKLYTDDIGMKVDTLVSVFKHKRITMIRFMEEFVIDREQQVRAEIEKLHSIKNKNMQEAFARLEAKWDSIKRTEITGALNTIQEMADYIQTIYKAENDKWIPYLKEIEEIIDIKDREGNKLPIVLMKYYLSEYMLAGKIEPLASCEAIKKFIDEKQIRIIVNGIYKRWLQEDADINKKNILILYALNASDVELIELDEQIDEWTKNSRWVIGAFAVTAMAMNGSPMALMLTDGIIKRYKYNQVRAAAIEAMDYVEKVRGLSKEALADKSIPNLGFNKNREIMLNYGMKHLSIKLTSEMKLVLFDEEKQKVIKALPKPRVKDDEGEIVEAQKMFTGFKKKLKTIISTQQKRLFKAILTERSWEQDSWRELFVENPIMNGFAISLIWGEYDSEGVLLGTFRYMEDGSFNSAQQEEYKLGEGTVIKLIHPVELSEGERIGWKQQLQDYEIIQPVLQLDMPVYTLAPEEKGEPTFSKFKGEKVYLGKVLGVMKKYEWKKTAVLDGGAYEGFYYEAEAFGIGMLIQLDTPYIGMSPTDTVDIDNLLFYKKDTIHITDHYDEQTLENSIIPLQDVPVKTLNIGLMIIHLLRDIKV